MVTILGIRHHGVGSAQQVQARLEALRPDIILVEGPPEADPMLRWIGDENLKPPVAMLCFDEANPRRAAFYPFSEFSPEWQAIRYANKNKIPVKMMDLPMALSWELAALKKEQQAEDTPGKPDPDMPGWDSTPDPMAWLARIAGYDNTDLWWEHQFEHHAAGTAPEEHFEAVMLAMKTLRQAEIPSSLDWENEYREAWMGNLIRQAQREMYDNIVVVCGAWHGPALLELDKSAKAHAQFLKKLPKSKIKVGVTWAPWTNSRLSFQSGYGAGLHAPGWYYHLWKYPADKGERWLTKVAHALRQKHLDTSTAHVIEAYRLAGALAGMRDLTRAGLQEMNEAVTTVMCMGDAVLLDFVKQELIVGHVMGKVPDKLPKLPLQADFESIARKLGLPLTAGEKDLLLDLRKETDLKRSVFFYRLLVLELSWAKTSDIARKGTFREKWTLSWNPEILITLIEKGIWGNTIEEAAESFLLETQGKPPGIALWSGKIAQAIPAELYRATEVLLQRIQDEAAVSSDIADLMRAFVPLAGIDRYGNVRKSDKEAIQNLTTGLVTRICIGLPTACMGLDGTAAQSVFDLIRRMQDVLKTMEQQEWLDQWFAALHKIADAAGTPHLLNGCVTRLLFNARILNQEETARRFGLAMSTANDPAESAAWLEGFLKGSGMILLYDDVLWNLVHQWVAAIDQEVFTQQLPVLRRTFAQFPPPERQKLGEKAKKGLVAQVGPAQTNEWDTVVDESLALPALNLISRFLFDQNPAQ